MSSSPENQNSDFWNPEAQRARFDRARDEIAADLCAQGIVDRLIETSDELAPMEEMGAKPVVYREPLHDNPDTPDVDPLASIIGWENVVGFEYTTDTSRQWLGQVAASTFLNNTEQHIKKDPDLTTIIRIQNSSDRTVVSTSKIFTPEQIQTVVGSVDRLIQGRNKSYPSLDKDLKHWEPVWPTVIR